MRQGFQALIVLLCTLFILLIAGLLLRPHDAPDPGPHPKPDPDPHPKPDPDPHPTPASSCVPQNSTEFPPSPNILFVLQFRNSCDHGITVWLQGNQPPCTRSVKKGCTYEQGDVWGPEVSAMFYVQRQGEQQWTQIPAARNVNLDAGAVLRIVPAQENNAPAWYYRTRDGTWQSGGTRAWVTRTGLDPSRIVAAMSWSLFEFNITPEGPDYDLSGVDGLNANMTVEFTGACGAQATRKAILPELAMCPQGGWRKDNFTGVTSCAAPKWTLLGNDRDLAACGVGANCQGCVCGPNCKRKMDCHRWWNTDSRGIGWRDFVQKLCPAGSDAYAWAYDEMLWKEGDSAWTCNCDPGPSDQSRSESSTPSGCIDCAPTGRTRSNATVNPNVNCQGGYTNGDQLNVDILRVL